MSSIHRFIFLFTAFGFLLLTFNLNANFILAAPKDPKPSTPSVQNLPLQLIKDKQNALKNGANQENWLNEALGSNLVSGVRALSGDIPDEILNGQYDPNDPIIYQPGGAIGGTSNLISALYNPPVSGIEYLAQLKNTFLGKPALAQGTGFAGLSPILPIWKVFRNLVYLAFSFVFIIIGLMVILRVKVNPQTVISLQSSIPSIFIALILVTFSYAIAGFLIDLIYLIQGVFVALLFNAGSNGSVSLSQDLFPTSMFEKVQGFFSQILGINVSPKLFSYPNVANPGFFQFIYLVKALLPATSLIALGGVIGAAVGSIIGILTLNPITAIGGSAAGLAVGGPLLILIMQIVILIALIRFFFSLIKYYFSALLQIILAPLEIGMGAFPNSKLNFSSWFFGLVANLAIFPISIIFVIIANLIIRNTGSIVDSIWAPSPIGAMSIINLVPGIIGFAAILILPKLPDLIHQTVFQIKPSPWGNALGESYKTFIAAPVGAATTFGLQYGSDRQAQEYKGKTDRHLRLSTVDKIENAAYNTLRKFGTVKG